LDDRHTLRFERALVGDALRATFFEDGFAIDSTGIANRLALFGELVDIDVCPIKRAFDRLYASQLQGLTLLIHGNQSARCGKRWIIPPRTG
jgi:hypothetical protein